MALLERKKTLLINICHPLLLASYPILFLYSQNLGQALFFDTFLPWSVSVLGASVLLILIGFISKNLTKAAIFVSLFSIWFFSFGHLYRFLNHNQFISTHIVKNQNIFFWIWLTLLVAIIACLIRIKRNMHQFSLFLTLVGILLVAFSLIKIISFEVNSISLMTASMTKNQLSIEKSASTAESAFPDIYYIILDGYARNDVLKEDYGFDNALFLNFLRQNGFYLAEKSRANYNQTPLSLSSSLNMRYLEELAGLKTDDRTILYNLIKNNTVRKTVDRLGYSFISFASSYDPTEIKDADIYIAPELNFSEFDIVLLETTALTPFYQFFWHYQGADFHRAKINYTLNNFTKVTKSKKRKFVFCHLIVPHPPFIFGQNGQDQQFEESEFTFADGSGYFEQTGATKEQYRARYISQLKFVNDKMKPIIKTIIKQSPRPTLIILQADHGPGSMLDWENLAKTNLKERMSIFSAYYFYDGNYKNLSPDINPVNSFRLIFDQYFQIHQPKLSERQYFSTWSHPFDFEDVTDRIKN